MCTAVWTMNADNFSCGAGKEKIDAAIAASGKTVEEIPELLKK